jgi:WD40 repeat protein
MHNVQSSSIVSQNYPMWKELPKDLSLEVLSHLSPRKVGTCNLICKQWSRFLNSPEAWQFLSRCHLSYITPGVIKSFQGYVNLYSNLTHGVCSEKTPDQLHAGTVWSLIVEDEKLFSGSSDNMIKIWNPTTGDCLANLQGHTNWVCSLAIKGDKLFSGSCDHTIRIWNRISNICIGILQGHKDMVCALAISGDKLFSGSADHTIKIWDLNTHACIATLEEHKGTVRSLVIEGDKLFSGSWDKTIKIWDLATHACINTLGGHTKTVCSLATSGNKLFSGAWDGSIKIWDLANCTNNTTLCDESVISIYSLAVEGGKLFSGDAAGEINIWDLATHKCIATLKGHKDGVKVTSLAIKDGKLFSGAEDHTVKIWDFTVSHAQIFMEIARGLGHWNQKEITLAIERFSKMPKAAKNKIFTELYKIIKPKLKRDYWGCAEDAFYGRNGQNAKNDQKAKAIQNYVMRPISAPPKNR